MPPVKCSWSAHPIQTYTGTFTGRRHQEAFIRHQGSFPRAEHVTEEGAIVAEWIRRLCCAWLASILWRLPGLVMLTSIGRRHKMLANNAQHKWRGGN